MKATFPSSILSSAIAILLIVLLSAGCGSAGGDRRPAPSGGTASPSGGTSSGGGGTTGGGTTTNASSPVLLTLGDFASVPNQIVALELTIKSVTVHSPKGDVGLVADERRFEFGRLRSQPILLSQIDQGIYNGVTLGISDPKVSYFDADNNFHEKVAASLASLTATSPNTISISSTPATINLNLFFGAALGSDGIMTLAPSLNMSTQTGPIEDLVGRVNSIHDSFFFLDVARVSPTFDGTWDGSTLIFGTDAGTEFKGITGISDLTAGMTVEVDAVFAPGPGGSLHATKVKLKNTEPSQIVVEGLALGLAPTQLNMLVRESHGPWAASLPEVGSVLTLSVNTSTQFRFESDEVDLQNLDFTPSFDALTIAPGQNLRATTASGNAVAINLELAKQVLDGSVGSITAGSTAGQYSFPLQIAADSAFAKVTGQSTVYVTLQPSAEKFLLFGNENCVTCISGSPVRVHGLLFFAGGQYHLVSSWLSVM